MKYVREDGTMAHYLTVRKAAEYLGVTAITLRNWSKEQNKRRYLKCYVNPITRYRLYKQEDLDTFLNNIKSLSSNG